MARPLLRDTPQETWPNTILYALTVALESPTGFEALLSGPQAQYTVDPDEILDKALMAIAVCRSRGE